MIDILGKPCSTEKLLLESFSELNKLKQLQKVCSKLTVEILERFCIINVYFFGTGFFFHLEGVSHEHVIDLFYARLISHIETVTKVSNHWKYHSEYQDFWQFVLRHESKHIFQNRSYEFVSKIIKQKMKIVVLSFSDETKQIYDAMETFYELKNP